MIIYILAKKLMLAHWPGFHHKEKSLARETFVHYFLLGAFMFLATSLEGLVGLTSRLCLEV